MAKAKKDKIGKSYHFFLEQEKEKTGFKLAELAKVTGWSEVTVKTYLSKKWDSILTKKGDDYHVVNISKYSAAEYSKMMSQVNRNCQDPLKPEFELEIERLIVKARESALLSLDIYNRPATMFKSEGFVVMMIIAWTSLFHAISKLFLDSKNITNLCACPPQSSHRSSGSCNFYINRWNKFVPFHIAFIVLIN